MSPLQAKWLRRASDNGIKVMVILGVGTEGGICFDVDELDITFTRNELSKRIHSVQDIADYITEEVMFAF